MKKKLLIIMEGYIPGKKYGGPVVSIKNFCNYMNMFEILIVTKNHDLGEKKPYSNIKTGWNNINDYKVKYLNDDEFSIKNLEKEIIDIKPDCIYIQSIFQAFTWKILSISKLKNIKVILAPRGELCKGAFAKKYKKVPYLIILKTFNLFKNVYFQATSEEEYLAIVQTLLVSKNRVFIAENFPSKPLNSNASIEKDTGLLKLIYLSRIVPKKNLLGAIKSLKSVKSAILFDIYGPIEDKGYWDKCLIEINKLPKNVTVQYKGIIDYDDVQNVFSKYHLFIFPTFSENYGHVIIESLIAGCPVLISDQTPWSDLLTYGVGNNIPVSDIDKYSSEVDRFACMNNADYIDIHKNITNYIKKKLDEDNLVSLYDYEFNKIIEF